MADNPQGVNILVPQLRNGLSTDELVVFLKAIAGLPSLNNQTSFAFSQVTEDVEDNSYYTKNRIPTTGRIYPIDIVSLISQVIPEINLNEDQQKTIFSSAEYEYLFNLVQQFELNSSNPQITTDDEQSFNNAYKIEQIKQLAGNLVTALQETNKDDEEEKEEDPDEKDEAPADEEKDDADKDSAETSSVSDEDSDDAADSGGDDSVDTDPDSSPKQPPPPETPEPTSQQQEINPLEDRSTQTELLRIQQVALIALFEPLGVDWKDLPPDQQRELQKLSFDATEQLILKLDENQLAKLTTDPLARTKLLREVLDQLKHTPRFQEVYQKSIDSHYLSLETNGKDEEAAALSKNVEDHNKESKEQYENRLAAIVERKIDVSEELKKQPGLSRGSQQDLSVFIENLFNNQESGKKIDPSKLNFITTSINNDIEALIAQKYHPDYIDTLDWSKLRILLQTDQPDGSYLTREQFKDIEAQLKQVLKSHWKQRVTYYQKTFGNQVGVVWQANSEESLEALKKESIDDFHKRFERDIKPMRVLLTSKHQFSNEEIMAAKNTALGDEEQYLEEKKYRVNAVKALRAQLIKEYWDALDNDGKEANQRFYNIEPTPQNKDEIPAAANIAHLGAISPDSEFGSYQNNTYINNQGNPVVYQTPQSSLSSLKAPRSRIGKYATKKAKDATKKAVKMGSKAVDKALDGTVTLAEAGITAWNPAVGKIVGFIPKPIKKGVVIAAIGGLIAGGGLLVGGALTLLSKATGLSFGSAGGIPGGTISTASGADALKGMSNAPYRPDAIKGLPKSSSFAGAKNKINPTRRLPTGETAQFRPPQTGGFNFNQPRLSSMAKPGLENSLSKASTITKSVFNSTSGQAVLGGIGATAAGTYFVMANIQSAFLVDVPTHSPGKLDDPQNKESKYVEIEKEAVSGCPDNKCEELSGNQQVEVTYTITITPKDDYVITVNEFSDTLSAKYNEEMFTSVPVKDDRVLSNSDFEEMEAGSVIPPEGLSFSYTEDFDSSYNHSTIKNEVLFTFHAANEEGSDSSEVTTIDFVYIGEFPLGEGCWPASGKVVQVPFGTYSHRKPPSGGWADAFDITNVTGTPIYAPFSGEMCGGDGLHGFGNFVILKTADHSFVFAHFDQEILPYGVCETINEGELIGPMGSSGFGGAHLHYEIYRNGRWYSAKANSKFPEDSILFTLVPPDRDGRPIEGETQYVETCY